MPELLQPVVPETTDKNEVNVCIETGPSPVIERFRGSRQFYDASDQPAVVHGGNSELPGGFILTSPKIIVSSGHLR